MKPLIDRFVSLMQLGYIGDIRKSKTALADTSKRMKIKPAKVVTLAFWMIFFNGTDEQKEEITNPSNARIQSQDLVDALGSIKRFLGVL